MESILRFVKEEFPQLEEKIRWGQPMFTDHGTFIIGFSLAREQLAVAPQLKTIKNFQESL